MLRRLLIAMFALLAACEPGAQPPSAPLPQTDPAPARIQALRPGDDAAPTFQIPFTWQAEPGDGFAIDVDPGKIANLVLGVRVFRPATDDPKKTAEDIRLLADGQLVAPTMSRPDVGQLAWKITWPLAGLSTPLRLEFGDTYSIAVKVGKQPLQWSYRPQQFLRPNPFDDPDSLKGLEPASVLIDYFNWGAYEDTIRDPAFRHCARADDYAVVYLPPGRRGDTFVSVSVPKDTCRSAESSWAVYVDNRKFEPTCRTNKDDNIGSMLLWRFDAAQRRIVLDVGTQPFRLAVSDAKFDWATFNAEPQSDEKRPPATPLNPTIRIDDRAKPCLP